MAKGYNGTSYTKSQYNKIQAGHAAFSRANGGRAPNLKEHQAIVKAAGVKYKPLAKSGGRGGASAGGTSGS